MNVTPGKKIYFLSDFHLGIPDYESSLAREKKVVAFLESIRNNAEQIFILGDMFEGRKEQFEREQHNSDCTTYQCIFLRRPGDNLHDTG